MLQTCTSSHVRQGVCTHFSANYCVSNCSVFIRLLSFLYVSPTKILSVVPLTPFPHQLVQFCIALTLRNTCRITEQPPVWRERDGTACSLLFEFLQQYVNINHQKVSVTCLSLFFFLSFLQPDMTTFSLHNLLITPAVSMNRPDQR